jgi:hypothetical protein
MLDLIMVFKILLYHLFIFFLHLLFHPVGLLLRRRHPRPAGAAGSKAGEKENDQDYVSQTGHFDVKIKH